jgi:endonuclease/exonuclease/phosphatase family metal-dependent hydrolase
METFQSCLTVQDYLSNPSYYVVALGVQVSERAGWISVDFRQGNKTMRVVGTHLNFNPLFDPTIAIAQANELLATASAAPFPTVIAGDLNANANTSLDPTHQTYQTFRDAGYDDAWSIINGSEPGLTCCQDENLSNNTAHLSVRYDMILPRGARVTNARLVNSQRVLSLWSSDHAGVLVTVSQ